MPKTLVRVGGVASRYVEYRIRCTIYAGINLRDIVTKSNIPRALVC